MFAQNFAAKNLIADTGTANVAGGAGGGDGSVIGNDQKAEEAQAALNLRRGLIFQGKKYFFSFLIS